MQIGRFNIFKDEKNKNTIVVFRKENPNTNRNLYRWDPQYSTFRPSEKNNWECPDGVIIQAFASLFPEVAVYQNVANKNNNKVSRGGKTMELMKEMLRKQAQMIKQQTAMITQQAEMIEQQTEFIISMADNEEDRVDAESNIDEVIDDDFVDIGEEDDKFVVRTKEDEEEMNRALAQIHEVEDEEIE